MALNARKPRIELKASVEDVLQRVARPAWRSPLFCWLIEHHDALRQNEAETGRGVPWRELCVDFVRLGITLADGRPVKPATARITWQRVRRELVHVDERRARERAASEDRRANDPRRNMPSRFPRGNFAPPLAERPLAYGAPPRSYTPEEAKTPEKRSSRTATSAVVAVAGSGGTGPPVMPGGPILTGGFEQSLPAETFTVMFHGDPLDLRLFIVPGEERFWELPGADEVGGAWVLKQQLLMRFDFVAKRPGGKSPQSCRC